MLRCSFHIADTKSHNLETELVTRVCILFITDSIVHCNSSWGKFECLVGWLSFSICLKQKNFVIQRKIVGFILPNLTYCHDSCLLSSHSLISLHHWFTLAFVNNRWNFFPEVFMNVIEITLSWKDKTERSTQLWPMAILYLVLEFCIIERRVWPFEESSS